MLTFKDYRTTLHFSKGFNYLLYLFSTLFLLSCSFYSLILNFCFLLTFFFFFCLWFCNFLQHFPIIYQENLSENKTNFSGFLIYYFWLHRLYIQCHPVNWASLFFWGLDFSNCAFIRNLFLTYIHSLIFLVNIFSLAKFFCSSCFRSADSFFFHW